MKGQRLALEPVRSRRATSRHARERRLHRTVEEVRHVGLPPAEPPVQGVHGVFPEPPARPLVGARGVRVPVAENDLPRGERRLDGLDEMVAAVGEHQQQLDGRVEASGRVEQDVAERPPDLRSSGLPGRDDRHPEAAKPRGDARNLGRLS